jgi:hypothetical protein
MDTTRIESAIASHQAWVARFRSILSGISTEKIDPDVARDDLRCAFGQWLHSETARFDNPVSHERVKALHRAFHEIAGEITVMIRDNHERAGIDAYMIEFDNLSKQLVGLLRTMKSNLVS